MCCEFRKKLSIWFKPRELMNKVTFSNPTTSDPDANWWDFLTLIFFLKPLGIAQKSYRFANFSFFNKVGTTFYVPSQWVLIIKISDWVRWKGILIRKVQKIQKPTIFFNFFSVDFENFSGIFGNLGVWYLGIWSF
jgi:hypothetical protein